MCTNKLIMYGAGKMGRAYLQFLRKYNLDNRIECFCDKKYISLQDIDSFSVLSYEDAKKLNLTFIVAVKKELKQEVINNLENDNCAYYLGLDRYVVDELGLMSRVDYEREICAISHVNTMDEYFDVAENEGAMDFFWNKQKDCYRLFRKLDLTNVVELACGRGRHATRYINLASDITLVDILENNIEFCKKRFADIHHVNYIVNNGYDLSQLSSDSYTSLFSYDSMVHFEMLDIANYLSETYRILKKGGRALFHHSNNHSDYKAAYDNAIESRSYMSKDIFAYLAYRVGFEIEEQVIVDWIEPELDCLTLVIKR